LDADRSLSTGDCLGLPCRVTCWLDKPEDFREAPFRLTACEGGNHFRAPVGHGLHVGSVLPHPHRLSTRVHAKGPDARIPVLKHTDNERLAAALLPHRGASHQFLGGEEGSREQFQRSGPSPGRALSATLFGNSVEGDRAVSSAGPAAPQVEAGDGAVSEAGVDVDFLAAVVLFAMRLGDRCPAPGRSG
jgi:hypothetical protein